MGIRPITQLNINIIAITNIPMIKTLVLPLELTISFPPF